MHLYPLSDVAYNLSAANTMKSFKFDKVFGPEQNQESLFKQMGGSSLITKVL